MNIESKIYVAGHTGMVGSAIYRNLLQQGFTNIITKTSAGLNLKDANLVNDYFSKEQPEYVFLAAAKVGGIMANNNYKADFIFDNLMIEANIIHAAYQYKIKKLLFLGSSCIYPKMAPQPLKEEYLLTGPLEPTNEPYAIAKIVGIKMCEAFRAQHGCNFISVLPSNLYGAGDKYDLNNSHVLPALIRKIHEAKLNNYQEVTVWGSGTPKREFLYADDLANACIYLMQNYDGLSPVNVGTGKDISIAHLAEMISKIICFEGAIVYDTGKPDGTPKKLLDVTRIHDLGWHHTINLEEGVKLAYTDFLNNIL